MTALFVTYGGGHVHMVVNVARALRALSPAIKIKILGLPSALPILAETEFETLSFVDLIEPSGDEQVLLWGEKLARDHHSDHTGVERTESIAYLGLSFKDLVSSVGYDSACESLNINGRRAFLPLTALNRALDLVNPSIVITTNSPRAEAAAIAAANARNIPTIAMVDLFGGIKGYKIEANDVTVLNEKAQCELIMSNIVDPKISKIHLTGNPAFDSIISNTAQADYSKLKTHILDLEDKPSVLHADIPAWIDPKTRESYFKSDSEIIDELTKLWEASMAADANYLLRPHPGQSRELFQGFSESHEGCYLVDKIPLILLLKYVDLLIARSTTVALESVYLRQNIIQLDPHLHIDLPIAEMGVARGVALDGPLAAEVKHSLSYKGVTDNTLQNMNRLFPIEAAAPKVAKLIAKRKKNENA